MLVQALTEYARTRLENAEEAFEDKPVPYLLEVATDGTFRGVIERTETVEAGGRARKRPLMLSIPKSPVNRNSGVHPLLACDDMKWLFGPTGQSANLARKHEAFVELIRHAAEQTSDDGLRACAAFYNHPDQVAAAQRGLAERKVPASAVLAFSTADGPVVSRPLVRGYWLEHYRRAFASRMAGGGKGRCLVDGADGPVAPTHDKIKHLADLGGQPAGVSLMSFDKAAFCSYGWEQNANSPVCPEHAAAYVLAFNDLLRPGQKSRMDRGGVAFISWTKRPVDGLAPLAILESADVEQVRRLLLLDQGATTLDANEFYFAGVSGNGGRLLVRYWMHDKLANVVRNVGAWFEGLCVTSPFTGGMAEAPKLWQLLAAIARKDPPPDRAVQLLRRAIHGVPLGRTILAAALGRLRTATQTDRLNTARAGLIRLAVNDLSNASKGEFPMPECLDPDLGHPAYLCGRLLAVYDSLQYAAQGEVKVTVADRYFSLASTYPALAFPKIGDLGLKHMRKLRRDNRAAAVSIERELQDLHTRLATGGAKFPTQLSLEEQGRFAIGYHHQRADTMARIQAKKQEREQNGQAKA